MNTKRIARWLCEPVLTGRFAILFCIFAVVFPTLVRAAISGSVTGCEFTPYLPFVLLTAMTVGWWQAGIVAVVSVAVMGGLFVSPHHHFLGDACATSAASVFLASSAILIAVVAGVQQVIAQIRRGPSSNGGIIFSLEKGEVWASWNGSGPPMSLGRQAQVEAMMEDFLAQGELSKRLDEVGK